MTTVRIFPIETNLTSLSLWYKVDLFWCVHKNQSLQRCWLQILSKFILLCLQNSGIKTGDFIIRIGGVNVKWLEHGKVVQLIRDAGQRLVLHLVTPLDKHYTNNNQITKESHDKKNNNKARQVMQCGTLDRNKVNRLSGRSTKSLTFTLRRLQLNSHPTKDNKKDKRHLKDIMTNWDRNKHWGLDITRKDLWSSFV